MALPGKRTRKGSKICARGIAALLPAAERHGVTICMELLNSTVDHKDYQCDRTRTSLAEAVRICRV
jgi:hydroxypyruvate isomerase